MRVKERVKQFDQFANFLTACNHFRNLDFQRLPDSPLDYRFILKFESLEFFELANQRMKSDLLLEFLARFSEITVFLYEGIYSVVVWGLGDGKYRLRTNKNAFYANLDEVLSAIDEYWP